MSPRELSSTFALSPIAYFNLIRALQLGCVRASCLCIGRKFNHENEQQSWRKLFALKNPSTRPHCKFSLFIWSCKAPSRKHITEIFQICWLLEELEEIEFPATMQPGDERHCKQRHSPFASTSVCKCRSLPAFSHTGAKELCRVHVTSPTSLFFSYSLSLLLRDAFRLPHWMIKQSHLLWSVTFQAVCLA